MKNSLSNFTTKCLIFKRFFYFKMGVTTHEVEDTEQDMFSGTVYINRHEFICVEKERTNTWYISTIQTDTMVSNGFSDITRILNWLYR